MHLFEQYCQNIRVEILHGDITSESESSPSNIVKKVGAIVQSFLNKYSLKKTDIAEIIQITDTDGAFISTDKVHRECQKFCVWGVFREVAECGGLSSF